MNKLESLQGITPTPRQELLLRATLLQGDEAVAAWQQWRVDADIDTLDAGSYRLLPLLYQMLRTHNIQDPMRPRLKGIYRLTWYQNQLLFHKATEVLETFAKAGIEAVVLKGAALTLLCYADHGLRPMHDFDVWIHRTYAQRAVEVLGEHGWQPKRVSSSKLTETHFSILHAHNFLDTEGRELDLHWRALLESRRVAIDDILWDRAIPLTMRGFSTRTLSPTDQLLYVCIHGTAWDPIPPLRWIADACMILRTYGSELEWDHLLEQAEELDLVLRVRSALSYLAHTLALPIPARTLQGLERAPVTALERREFSMLTRPPGRLGHLPWFWARYLRLRHQADRDDPLGSNPLIGFCRFVQHYMGFHHWWDAIPWMLSRGLYRISSGTTDAFADSPDH